jgi:hypothetical protein
MEYMQPKQNPSLRAYTIFKGQHNSQLSNDYTSNLAKVNQKPSKSLLRHPFIIPTFLNAKHIKFVRNILAILSGKL